MSLAFDVCVRLNFRAT